MKKTWIFAGIASFALATTAAIADTVEKFDGTKMTVAGKDYRISASRTKITIGGAPGTREAIKVGMDCAVTGAAGSSDAAAVDCK